MLPRGEADLSPRKKREVLALSGSSNVISTLEMPFQGPIKKGEQGSKGLPVDKNLSDYLRDLVEGENFC